MLQNEEFEMESRELIKLRREATQKFLLAYKLRKQLGAVATEDNETTMKSDNDFDMREKCAHLVRPFDHDIDAGQVRVLFGVESIAYVLVTRKWDEGSWLVIPFSMYSSPATDTELQTKVTGGMGLRVLQLWNARSLLTQTLEKSWLVHTLSEEDLADALTAWQWTVGVGELTEDQLARTGMPITNRKDSRIEYQDISLANFAKLDAEDLALSERLGLIAAVREAIAGKRQSAFVKAPIFEKQDYALAARYQGGRPRGSRRRRPIFEKQDYALAAAGTVKPVTANCKVNGLDGSVHLRYDPEKSELRLRVFGPDGNRSRALDGWTVFGKNAAYLGNIVGADFIHKFDCRFDGILNLVDENGAVNPLVSVQT